MSDAPTPRDVWAAAFDAVHHLPGPYSAEEVATIAEGILTDVRAALAATPADPPASGDMEAAALARLRERYPRVEASEDVETCPTCWQPVERPQPGDHDYGIPLQPARLDVEAAWDALRDDLARVSWSHRNAVIAKYRPIIMAAIRAEAETRLTFYEDQLRLTREQLTAIRAAALDVERCGCGECKEHDRVWNIRAANRREYDARLAKDAER